jgi:diguanylate cyclase (GGDEF)-like protein
MIFSLPHFEQQKNEVLQRYRTLNGAEGYFAGQIAQTAAQAFGVPIVLASLNERYRSWYSSDYGVDPRDAERLDVFCMHANLAQSAFALHDIRQEPHFALDPVVTVSPKIAFFAGAPLRDPDGKRFGSLCLLSDVPQVFGDDKLQMLQSFAAIMSQDICVRSAARYAVRDLIEAEHDKCDLFDLAMTDPLTKALNRRAFYRFAEREVLRSSRHCKPMSAVMFDIDHFKKVNDVHGHAVGDEVLTQLVSCVARNIRDEDLLGRLGGEEFALVLPETETSKAAILANRLRESVSELRFSGKDGKFSVSISAGISEPTLRELDIIATLERADQALYVAKQNGRNRVELAPSRMDGMGRAVA